ncbi:MAG: hypothetical protein V8R19_08860 [Bacteroides uniformis]
MTKHVPLFLPLGSIRLLTIFFSFCIIFVHPALADKMAESPELFDTAFTLQERLDIPDGFVQREMVYISILLGTLVLCLFFFLHAEADEEIEGKGPGEVSATVGRHS